MDDGDGFDWCLRLLGLFVAVILVTTVPLNTFVLIAGSTTAYFPWVQLGMGALVFGYFFVVAQAAVIFGDRPLSLAMPFAVAIPYTLITLAGGLWGREVPMAYFILILAPANLVIPFAAGWLAPRFFFGCYFLFVPHPAATTINRATGSDNAPLDAGALAQNLKTAFREPEPPPSFLSTYMRREAEKLRKKAEEQRKRYHEDARLAEGAIEMERARHRRNDAPTGSAEGE